MAKDDDKKAKKGKDAEDDADDKKKDGEEGEGGDGTGAEDAPKKGLSKKMIIIIAAAAVVVLGGAGAGLYFSGVLGGKKAEVAVDAHGNPLPAGEGEAAGEHGEKKDKEKEGAAIFYNLGDVVVNLTGEGKRPNFLKINIALELENEKDKLKIDQIKPRILDNFQVYLRELRIDDLKGSAGIYRLREELLLRVTEAAAPARVRDVLFQEMLVQ